MCCTSSVGACCSSLPASFFFFKQKTAYEMRISDWSSDVCSSDLAGVGGRFALAEAERAVRGDAAECLGPVMAAAAAGTLRRAAVDDQAILAMAELEGQQAAMRPRAGQQG